jgi:voltage-gated sodium channel
MEQLHMKAELANHRAELEQTIRRELELLRESITKEILKEIRSLQRPEKDAENYCGPESSASRRPKQRSAPERPPQTEETAYSAAEPDKPLLETRAPSRESSTRAEPSWIATVVMSPVFDNLASFLVFLSVIFLAVQTEYMARTFTSEPPFVFRCVEIGFSVIFSVEILLRLCVYGKAFWTDRNKYWNMFDLSLVSMQVTEMLIALVNNGQRLPFAPFLRCLRIARMVRVARFLRLVPELRTLIVQIFHSFLPLMWVFILVFLVTAVFAVILTQVVTDYKVANEEEFSEQHPLRMFDNLPLSMLALYQTISEGKHWGELSEPLMEVNPYLAVLFIGYTFFVIFAFMNVVTSHFVEEALESAKQDDRQQMLEKLEDIFGASVDSNGGVKSAELDEDQFLEVCNKQDMKSYLAHLLQRHDVSADEVKEMQLFRILDLDGSGLISTKELVQGCERLTRAPTVLDLAAFRQMCTDFFAKLEDVVQDKKVT